MRTPFVIQVIFPGSTTTGEISAHLIARAPDNFSGVRFVTGTENYNAKKDEPPTYPSPICHKGQSDLHP
jgi:hypothetical protein